MEPQEMPEERMRAGLYSVWGRWDTSVRMGSRNNPLATAMAREAMQALVGAHPDDPLYRMHLAEMPKEASDGE